MEALAWILAAVAALVAVFFFFQWNAVKQVKAPAAHSPELEKKIEALRGELTAAREETSRKQKQLDEVREEAKKKLRREGKKAEREEEAAKAGTDPRDVEIQGLKKGLASLESQLNAAKRDAEQKTAELERIRGEARGEAEGAVKARDEERTRSRSLADENAALKRTLDELRAAKKKESERPDVPGTSLDLKSLPVEAVQELARYFRKGEEFERLYSVAQGQMQLSQDRYLELQRRYLAVCRELAIVAGAKPASDQEAKKLAEGVVTGTDQAARAASAGGPTAAAGAPGEAGKKRRRRRRKKKPGAPGEAVSAADAGDEGDEGGDEGDEADDSADARDDKAADSHTGPEPTSGAPAPASA